MQYGGGAINGKLGFPQETQVSATKTVTNTFVVHFGNTVESQESVFSELVAALLPCNTYIHGPKLVEYSPDDLCRDVPGVEFVVLRAAFDACQYDAGEPRRVHSFSPISRLVTPS